MITAATIGYHPPDGGEATTATFEVNAKTTDDALDQATKKLQLQLIEAVLDIRPWADRYQYS